MKHFPKHSTVVISFDENEEFVTANYRCQSGFKLEGKNKITCDLDTDEWTDEPPKCQQGSSILKLQQFLFSSV